MCQENLPHTITPLPPTWTVDTMQVGSMDSCCWCQILTLPSVCFRNWDSSDQATFFQSSTVQLLSPLQPQLPVLGWRKWNPTWFSAVVAHPPQGLTCCAFWEAFLFTSNVQSGYLSYRSLSVSSNQSSHSLLTTLIDKTFPSFFSPFWLNSRGCCVWKSQEISSYRNT